MRKEVSDELTHSIKIRSARKKNLRAVSDEDYAGEEKEEATEHTDNQEEYETCLLYTSKVLLSAYFYYDILYECLCTKDKCVCIKIFIGFLHYFECRMR